MKHFSTIIRAARPVPAAAFLLLFLSTTVVGAGVENSPAEKSLPPSSKAALSVVATSLEAESWPVTIAANGNIAAWQEAVIGAEVGNLRITEVLANVGDRVKKGQVLARIDHDTLAIELAEATAAVSELQAAQTEARANNERARKLQVQGFFSAQQGIQYSTADQSTLARLDAARARRQAAELRLSKASVVAPDKGTISARLATVGSLTQPGQELFRLIRGHRLEWRAEVTAAEIVKLKPGGNAILTGPGGQRLQGKLRIVAPTIDPQTRNGLVYVDLSASAGAEVRAGMFARGEFELGSRAAMTLPQSAVLLREGFAYVFRIDGDAVALSKVTQAKVVTGRRRGDRIEIAGGLQVGQRVVSSGLAFLADGDTVRVVAGTPAGTGKKP